MSLQLEMKEPCCGLMVQCLTNKVFLIISDENDEEYKLAIRVSNIENLYSTEEEEFVSAVGMGELKFCPFCGKELEYQINKE